MSIIIVVFSGGTQQGEAINLVQFGEAQNAVRGLSCFSEISRNISSSVWNAKYGAVHNIHLYIAYLRLQKGL